MITPFQVYIILQADTLIKCLGIATMLLLTITAIRTAAIAIHNDNLYSNEHRLPYKPATKQLILAAILGGLVAILPSTKTLAAMFIVPALTQDKVVDPVLKEGGELYQLFKKSMMKYTEPQEPVKSPNE